MQKEKPRDLVQTNKHANATRLVSRVSGQIFRVPWLQGSPSSRASAAVAARVGPPCRVKAAEDQARLARSMELNLPSMTGGVKQQLPVAFLSAGLIALT